MRAGSRETALVRVAMAVIAAAVVDEAFVHPERVVSACEHLVSGLVPVAIAVLAALGYPRLLPGLRACVAPRAGALAVAGGVTDGIRHAAVDGLAATT